MHMADALLSPTVGGTMLAVSAGILAYSVRDVRKNFDESRIPLMGVTGAFVFAAQMVNFSIPGTGSSGHISGAVLLKQGINLPVRIRRFFKRMIRRQ